MLGLNKLLFSPESALETANSIVVLILVLSKQRLRILWLKACIKPVDILLLLVTMTLLLLLLLELKQLTGLEWISYLKKINLNNLLFLPLKFKGILFFCDIWYHKHLPRVCDWLLFKNATLGWVTRVFIYLFIYFDISATQILIIRATIQIII